MVVKTVVVYLTVLVMAQSCKKENEIDGKCTECKEGEVLFGGFCEWEIEGCEIQASGNQCRKCFQPYLLRNNECVMEDSSFSPDQIIISLQKDVKREEIEKKYAQLIKD